MLDACLIPYSFGCVCGLAANALRGRHLLTREVYIARINVGLYNGIRALLF